MRFSFAVKFVVLSLSCTGLLLPPAAFGASPTPSPAPQDGPAVRIVDAALGPQGTLQGKLVSPDGTALTGARVRFVDQKAVVAETSTDADGRFAVSNLRQGTYLVVGGQGAMVCRAWPERIAPPSATPDVLLVSDGTLVRGQGLYEWISEHFWLTSALITAAIVVPIVTSQKDDPASF